MRSMTPEDEKDLELLYDENFYWFLGLIPDPVYLRDTAPHWKIFLDGHQVRCLCILGIDHRSQHRARQILPLTGEFSRRCWCKIDKDHEV